MVMYVKGNGPGLSHSRSHGHGHWSWSWSRPWSWSKGCSGHKEVDGVPGHQGVMSPSHLSSFSSVQQSLRSSSAFRWDTQRYLLWVRGDYLIERILGSSLTFCPSHIFSHQTLAMACCSIWQKCFNWNLPHKKTIINKWINWRSIEITLTTYYRRLALNAFVVLDDDGW